MPDPTQVVLIMTDSQGANVVGCYGRPEMRTPNIDRLAREGMRFDRAYTASPVCGPARSAIFTGTYPHTNGGWGNNMPIGLNVKTIGQRLRDRGILSAYMGKWHLDGTDYFGSGRCPDGWSEDYWFDMRRYLDAMSPENRKLSRELDTPEKAHKHGITEGFTYAHQVSDRALRFLSEHRDEPFLLVVSYDEPHHPHMCPPPFCDMFLDFDYALAPNASDPMAGKPPHIREWARDANLPTGRASSRWPMYFGCNSFVDYEMGRVLDAIDALAPGALVIYTSDHGEPLLSHGLPTKGPAMYDETTRIPFIVRWPGHTPGSTANPNPVSQISLTPTVLDTFGLETPPFLEGASLLPAFADPSARPNEAIFIEFNRYEVDHDSWGGYQPIRCAFDGRFKLAVNLLSTDELYDLESDPQELTNLIESAEHAAVRDRLHAAILDWMGDTRDPFRGPAWERRPWQSSRRLRWRGPTRHRKDDGYERRVLDYTTGLEIENWVSERGK
ncbi:MAG: sulfatase-like hydrolase/transferase [Armatimonadota bacterium]